MEVVDQTKLMLGIAFAVVGVAVLVLSRGTRGFNQRRQVAAIFLVGSAVFVAVGLGYLDL